MHPTRATFPRPASSGESRPWEGRKLKQKNEPTYRQSAARPHTYTTQATPSPQPPSPPPNRPRPHALTPSLPHAPPPPPAPPSAVGTCSAPPPAARATARQ